MSARCAAPSTAPGIERMAERLSAARAAVAPLPEAARDAAAHASRGRASRSTGTAWRRCRPRRRPAGPGGGGGAARPRRPARLGPEGGARAPRCSARCRPRAVAGSSSRRPGSRPAGGALDARRRSPPWWRWRSGSRSSRSWWCAGSPGPLRRLADAADRIGRDPRPRPVPTEGPERGPPRGRGLQRHAGPHRAGCSRTGPRRWRR